MLFMSSGSSQMTTLYEKSTMDCPIRTISSNCKFYKRPMGHITHLSHFRLLRRRLIQKLLHPIFAIVSPWIRSWSFFWMNLNPLHTRMICLNKIGPVVHKKNILKWPHPISALKKVFKIYQYIFYILAIISPWKQTIIMIWINLNSFHPRILLAKFGWNWPNSWFLKDHTLFLHFCDYLPFEEGQALSLNQLDTPSPKDDKYQVWMKLDQWFWRRRFLNIFSVFLHFRYYLPLEMTDGHHLNKSESPSPKDDLCQVWLKLAQWFRRRSRKCKSLQTNG